MAHLRVTPGFIFSCFFHFSSRLTSDVSFVVGASWRCGVLMTWGGTAGFRLGHRHAWASTPHLMALLLPTECRFIESQPA